MSNKNFNPIQREDELIPVLLQNQDFMNSSKLALQNYKKNRTLKKFINNKLIFNLSNFMSFNFTHFTKYSIAGIAVFTVLAGGLSAQALAPDTLKPTQIAQSIKDKYFSINKQSDNDPQIALKGDDTNYVAYLEGCDLGLKFPKNYDNSNLTLDKIDSDNSFHYSFGVKKINSMMFQPPAKENFMYTINCEPIAKSEEFKVSNLDLYFNRNISKQEITSNTLIKETGWFVSDTNLQNIYQFSLINEESQYNYFGYGFTVGDKRYRVYTNNKIREMNPVSFNDFQLQLGSQLSNEIKTKKDLFISNLPIKKDTNCENILNLSYKSNLKLNIIKSNDSSGGNMTIDNFTYVDGNYVQKDNDAQIIIACNESYIGSLKATDEFKNKISLSDLPSILSNNLKNNIDDNNVYGQKSDLKDGNNSVIFQDKNGNNIRILVFNTSVLQNDIGLKIDVK